MNKFSAATLGLAMIAGAASQAQAAFTVSLESEAPGIQSSTSGFHVVGVEAFDTRATGGGQTFASSFGGSSVFSGLYTNVGVNNADQYGGAGGVGRYANAGTGQAYTLDLTSTEPQGVTYFGFWLSALDRNNNVSFYQGGEFLFTFSAADAAAFINGLPNVNDYRGNPNPNFAGRNTGEPYSFLNFYARGATRFDQVVFSQGPGGGYESDNHTVGRWSRISGTVIGGVPGVPEPASWAMLIVGFGLVGASARRRNGRGTVTA